MNKMCAVFIGLLLAVHLSSQMVRAQRDNSSSSTTATPTSPTTMVNGTVTAKNGCERTAGAALLLLLPLALGLFSLHGWSN
ncbi:hypothetical protein INR49_014771 [Caranx melampygus]|nr:hypothetical protein INR49_014771 [Caranx melampygus]